MARFTFRLPDIGEGIAEAEIVAWHVKVGDRVEEDGRLADMMTDKATVEMESPVAGTVVEVAGAEGDVIAIGSALAVIETEAAEAEAPAAAQPADAVAAENPGVEEVTEVEARFPAPAQAPTRPSAPAKAGAQGGQDGADNPGLLPSQEHGGAQADGGPGRDRAILASPAVRARAKDLGIDLGQVKPQADGRIRHADLDAFLRYDSGTATAGATQRAAARPDEQVRVIGMRRRIAENMAASKRHIPHFTYVEEIDVTAVEAVRAEMNAGRGDLPKLTLLPFLITALCKAIPKFPMMNARYDDEAGVVTRSGAVHMGMAAQTDAGLMVPVIRNADGLSVWELAAEVSRLSDAARSGKAKSEEMAGGTITLTSLGAIGGVVSTPVINRPEVAIVGVNRIVERPVFDADGDIVRAKLMNLSTSCDHRVVDGWDAASFVQEVKRLLENPLLLLTV
ncbi:2-oxoisovalerate dehydrogenase E2 component (dihydrolipoyl transacylase) [Sphingomonas jejuensis]|uniref:Dihydrolipoamide acetyltransferase component of pyruvate dehydrogenase complex n=1 Tax=Sphingomonas jejuensis TaxID=904715 RepID=A0ABX0XIC3_9SPHN|nr:dihydrolipoamide acetyltransferase family protein [Sphingomonas jejuensis]NJC32980.1 2-oxoisovalerate dehydrogenase E2 component (dihydrolipoyl transacylase) [Sphingomonas jejuensis]